MTEERSPDERHIPLRLVNPNIFVFIMASFSIIMFLIGPEMLKYLGYTPTNIRDFQVITYGFTFASAMFYISQSSDKTVYDVTKSKRITIGFGITLGLFLTVSTAYMATLSTGIITFLTLIMSFVIGTIASAMSVYSALEL